jgi:hypothetical protein
VEAQRKPCASPAQALRKPSARPAQAQRKPSPSPAQAQHKPLVDWLLPRREEDLVRWSRVVEAVRSLAAVPDLGGLPRLSAPIWTYVSALEPPKGP